MSRNTHRVLFPVFCFALLLTGPGLRAAAAEGVQKTRQQLRKLETLQTGESRKLNKVVGDVAWLLEDLASNGLLQQAGGQKVKTFKGVIATVADTHLPAAAQHLRNARLEPGASRHHVASADEEVDTALAQLAKVLAGSSTLLVQEELVQELKDLIKVQTLVRGQTAEWGKALLISPDTAGAGKGPLMQAQANVLTRYQGFIEKLQKARDDALDEAAKSRFQQAHRVLAPPAPTNETVSKIMTPEPSTGDVLQAAIDQIERSDVLPAVGAQDRVIASLKAALQILSAGQFELAEFVAGLEKLIEKQKVLRKDTAAEEDLVQRGVLLEARQREIADEATDYSVDAPDLFVSKKGEYLVEPLMTALGEAVAALKAAQSDKELAALRAARKSEAVAALKAARKGKALTAQDKVIALLESVYGTAAEALEEEQEGNPFWAHSPEIPEDKWKLPDDGEEEDEALADEDMPEIFEGITGAELMIQPDSAAQGAQPDVSTALAANRFLGLEEEEDSEPPDFITDTGPPTVGRDDAPDAPGGKGEGDTSEVEKDRLARTAMQRRRQKAKVQEYVRQLPPEFRRQVADYYELIAE